MVQHVGKDCCVSVRSLLLTLERPQRGIVNLAVRQHESLTLQLSNDVPAQRCLEGAADALLLFQQVHQLRAVPAHNADGRSRIPLGQGRKRRTNPRRPSKPGQRTPQRGGLHRGLTPYSISPKSPRTTGAFLLSLAKRRFLGW